MKREVGESSLGGKLMLLLIPEIIHLGIDGGTIRVNNVCLAHTNDLKSCE